MNACAEPNSIRLALVSAFCVRILFCFSVVLSANADLPLARLLTIYPPGAKIGATIEMTVTGSDLDDPAAFFFSNTNIIGSPKPGEATKFIVTVASNTPPGNYDARFVGRFGISNPRSFTVGTLSEITEKDTNNSMATALEVPLNTTANGRAEATGIDFFKFSAANGQRILIDCATKAIDSRMSPVLTLCNSAGTELKGNREGGLLDFTPAADAVYFLKVHDMLFRGGPEYFYRLSITTGPHIDYIFPPSGLPGTRTNYTLYGRNLGLKAAGTNLQIDRQPLEKLDIEIELPSVPVKSPASTSVARFPLPEGLDYRHETVSGISNPFLISFATAPVIAELEPNNTGEQAQKVSLPCEITGQFYPAEDVDQFVFEAKKGAVYWMEVISQRLGLPTSPFLLIQRVNTNEKGETQTSDLQEVYASDANIGGTEFKTSTFDPVTRFEAKENGTYRVQIRDLFNSTQNHPNRLYRLSLRQQAPDFSLIALAPAPGPAKKDAREAHFWSPLLRRGETIPLKVLALRKDNFDGEIQIHSEGLPPGVSSSNAKIEAGKTSTLLWLTASDETNSWTGAIRIRGEANTEAASPAPMVRDAVGSTVVWNVPDYNTEPVQSRLTREIVLAVSGQEAAPISITPTEGTNAPAKSAPLEKIWEVKSGAKARIPLQVLRRGDFTEGLKLKVTGIPALESVKEIDLDAKATNTTLELDLGQNKVAPGLYTFVLQAQTKGKYRNNPEAAQAAELASKEAEKAATDLAAAAKKDPELAAKAREAETKKTALANRAKELAEKAKPKEVTFTVYSAPIRLKVLADEKKVASDKK